jgi:adenylate cyclase
MAGTLELAFLYADACSFAAAMARSPAATVARLEAGMKIFDQQCRAHGGRVIDKVGDSILLAFNNIDVAFLVAKECATQLFSAQNSEAEDAPFEFRIGVSCGRVHVSETSLYGHSINLAARICSLVSKGNIGVEADAWSAASKHAAGAQWISRRLFAKPDEPFVDFVEVATNAQAQGGEAIRLLGRNEPTIAVQHTPLQAPTANGNALIEALNWEFTSCFSSHGWRTNLHEQSPENNGSGTIVADYVVKCGTTSSRLGMRIFASLSSPHMKRGIQTFSRDTQGIDDGLIQVMALVSLVASAIVQSESERATRMKSAGVHQLVAAGRAAIAKFSREGFDQGMSMLGNAEVLDPEYPLLLSSVARAQTIAWRFGWMDGKSELLDMAKQLGIRAMALDTSDPRCEADLAFVKFWANETHDAVWHYERAVDVLPYHAELAADAGMVLGYTGQSERAVKILEHSIANIPNDVDYRLWSLGDVYHSLKNYKQSLNWLSRMKDQSQAQRLMAANKFRLGLDPSPHVAKVLAMQPDFSVTRWTSIQPFSDESERLDYEEALLGAGLPR